jgi:hypothetical protein
MNGQIVLIPCRLDRRDARHPLIEEVDGFPRKVVGGLCQAGHRLVVAAEWLREVGGRHRVRFADGAELWVAYGPRSGINLVRFGATAPDPTPAAQPLGPVDAGLPGRGSG